MHTQTLFGMISKQSVGALFMTIILVWGIGCKQEKSYPVTIETSKVELKDTTKFDLSYFQKTADGAYILPWKLLMGVKFEKKYDEKMAMDVELPIFSDTIKSLNGQKVEVEGFYIPVSETGDDNIVILSAFPFAQCFFCGKAGVESIVDILSPKKIPQMKLDSKIKFQGKLKLNRDNFDYLIYVLEEAELVEK